MNKVKKRPDIDQTSHSGILFEQYKLAVEMADRISARRASANSFYVSFHAILITGIFTLFKRDTLNLEPSEQTLFISVLSAVGIGISYFWYASLRFYKELNKQKYKIICKIEEQLPAKIYSDEGQEIKQKSITNIEYGLPITSIVVYGIILLYTIAPHIINALIYSPSP